MPFVTIDHQQIMVKIVIIWTSTKDLAIVLVSDKINNLILVIAKIWQTDTILNLEEKIFSKSLIKSLLTDFMNSQSCLLKNKKNLSIDCMLSIKTNGISNSKKYKIKKKYSNKCNNAHSNPILTKIKSQDLILHKKLHQNHNPKLYLALKKQFKEWKSVKKKQNNWKKSYNWEITT